MNKTVSVNITTFNRSQLLPRCLESVMQQNYQDLEINIVDDCSTDNTETIVAEFQKKDKRIRYYRHEFNKGNAFARNTALKNSRGFYIAFMDDDDVWIQNNKIEKQIAVFQNDIDNKIGIVSTSVQIVQENKIYNKIISNSIDSKNKILLGNSFIYNSTVLVKKEIFGKSGLFDEKLPRGIDSDFFRRVLIQQNYELFVLPDITTKVFETGPNRITPTNTLISFKKDILSNEICLSKFADAFKSSPKAKRIRKWNLFKKYIKLLTKETKWVNVVRMIKGMRL